MFENFFTPFFRPMITAKTAEDDLPIRDEEDALGNAH